MNGETTWALQFIAAGMQEALDDNLFLQVIGENRHVAANASGQTSAPGIRLSEQTNAHAPAPVWKLNNQAKCQVMVMILEENSTAPLVSSKNRAQNEGTCHLCFEQAQPKMYHSPKVHDEVDVFLKISWKPIFGRFFIKEF